MNLRGAPVLAVLTLTLASLQIFSCATQEDSAEYNEDHVFHVNEEEGRCRSEELKKVGGLISEGKCSPRPTLVHLAAVDFSSEVNPKTVMVNRCSGFCSKAMTCLPVNTSYVNITALRLQKQRNLSKCGSVEVLEHTSCQCMCTVKPEHCNSKQKYDANGCKCKCKNELKEKQACVMKAGHRWDREMCHCVCRVERECSTGLVWVPSYCKCCQVMMLGGEGAVLDQEVEEKAAEEVEEEAAEVYNNNV